MEQYFRIHGDNVVECERMVHIILKSITSDKVYVTLVSPSTLNYNLSFIYNNTEYLWHIALLPGFNKSGRRRWEKDILQILRDNGSMLDETPDAIITKIEGNNEQIICAIEFCSALQAGNQAWQRSGRAYSTGRTGCPYLYIVDFVKYELDSKTRTRKSLRFPNAAVPYSYISASHTYNNFIAQVYVRSEEFNKDIDINLKGFNEDDFAEKELSVYLFKKMAGLNTLKEENIILAKNLNVVMFLASKANKKTNFTPMQWKSLYNSNEDIIGYSIKNSSFSFHKKITEKGHHGQTKQMLNLIDELSVGLASKDLPFGIIPKNNRTKFSTAIKSLYTNIDNDVIKKISDSESDLIVCIIKGFKPKGDDNRPDRGILPLVSMLTSNKTDILTYIYGPVIEKNYKLLINNPEKLANNNGFWKSVFFISNYVLLDVPIINKQHENLELLLETNQFKNKCNLDSSKNNLSDALFSSVPRSYHEDDVDTGIHYLFSHILKDICFEGMCNPPGGDWSGFSIRFKDIEMRWLSLPRESTGVDGKRPDHIVELFGVFKKPLLLSIESKERSYDLEENVGIGLINYINALMNFVPSVERNWKINEPWKRGTTIPSTDEFEMISVAAYLEIQAQDDDIVFKKSHCHMLFKMTPKSNGWIINIATNNEKASILKEYLMANIHSDEIEIS